jgi:hypothetical protein
MERSAFLEVETELANISMTFILQTLTRATKCRKSEILGNTFKRLYFVRGSLLSVSPNLRGEELTD